MSAFIKKKKNIPFTTFFILFAFVKTWIQNNYAVGTNTNVRDEKSMDSVK